MLNYIWLGMLVVGFAVGIMNGRINQITIAAMDSAQAAITISIGLLGILCLWSGLMNIAEKSGMIRFVAKLARPFMKFLFPQIPSNHPAIGSVVMNLVANLFGLGNAATPLGLKAMNELQKLNPRKDTATDSMSMFLVLNTSCVQLVPATVIGIRVATHSSNPTEIIGTIWVATLCASIAGVTAAKLLAVFGRKG